MAFVQGTLNEEIYVKIPDGFKNITSKILNEKPLN